MMDVASSASKRPAIKEESRIYFAALGRRIKLLRKSRGYTQAEFARALGISQQAIFAYEFGDRRVSVVVLERIAKLYGISVDQVIGRAPERASPRRRLSPKAMRHAERIQGLSRTAQRFVIRIIDVLEIQARNGKSGHTQASRNEAEAPQMNSFSHRA
jgi:transcriptional regulator with XRE-family HTH domain